MPFSMVVVVRVHIAIYILENLVVQNHGSDIIKLGVIVHIIILQF